jgi:membrane protein
VVFSLDAGLMVFVPWVLLGGAVRPRLLLPGALLFAVTMLFVRPASRTWLPKALDVSAERYGSIGVAFTYLAWLYVVSFCLLLAAVIGQVVATDHASVGRWIRGERAARPDGGRAGRAG